MSIQKGLLTIRCAFSEQKKGQVSCCFTAAWLMCSFDRKDGVGVWCGRTRSRQDKVPVTTVLTLKASWPHTALHFPSSVLCKVVWCWWEIVLIPVLRYFSKSLWGVAPALWPWSVVKGRTQLPGNVCTPCGPACFFPSTSRMFISYVNMKNTQREDWKEIGQNASSFCLPTLLVNQIAKFSNAYQWSPFCLVLQMIDHEPYSVI